MTGDTAHVETPGRRRTDLSLLDLVGTLWRRKLLVIGITAASMVAVFAYALGSLLLPPEKSYLPNVYTARAVMLVTDQNSSALSILLSSAAAGLASPAGLNAGTASNGSIATLIAKSNTSIDELSAALDLTARYKIERSVKANTRRAVLSHLDVAFDDKTSALAISFTDIHPDFAGRVVNKLVEILDRRFATLGGSKALREKDLLEIKIAEVEAQTRKLEGELKAFTARHGVVDVAALATEQVTVMAQLRSELIMKELDIDNYEKFSTIDDPVIRRLKSERDSLAAKLVQMNNGSAGSVLPGQQQLPALGFEYAALQRDLEVQTELYKILTQQYELAKMNVAGQDPVFQVLELAETPDKKSGPGRAMMCFVVAVGGFLFAVLAALLLDAIDHVRNDPEAMRRLRGGR